VYYAAHKVGESPPFYLGKKMDVMQKVSAAIEPSLESMGYTLVLLKMGEMGRRKTLTIMAERKDEAPMGVEDCTNISRQVGAILDVEDPFTHAYDLEVCSPGLERPLTRLVDYSRFKGSEAKLETYAPISGRKRFRGTILGVQGEMIRLQVDKEEVEIGYPDIRTAKLVLSDNIFKVKK
jgi:ribosome maturation factor RimP